MKHLQHHQQIPIIIHIVSCHELDKLPCDGTNSIHIGIYIGILLNNSALIIQVSIVFCFFFTVIMNSTLPQYSKGAEIAWTSWIKISALKSLLSASSPPFSLVISVSNYTTVMICSMLCTINFCLTTSRLHSPPVLQQLIQRRLTNNRCLNIMITLFLTLWLSIPSKVTLNALMRMNVMSNICYGLYCHHITSPFNTWKILAPFVV